MSNIFNIYLTNNTNIVTLNLVDMNGINENGSVKTYSIGFVQISIFLLTISFLVNAIVLYLSSREESSFMKKIKVLDCTVSRTFPVPLSVSKKKS